MKSKVLVQETRSESYSHSGHCFSDRNLSLYGGNRNSHAYSPRLCIGNRDSAVGIAGSYRLDGRGIGVRVLEDIFQISLSRSPCSESPFFFRALSHERGWTLFKRDNLARAYDTPVGCTSMTRSVNQNSRRLIKLQSYKHLGGASGPKPRLPSLFNQCSQWR